MPRSFSRSMESSTCPTAFLGSMVPVRDRSRSASVDLPWSMCATMEKLRISAVAILARISRPALDGANSRAPGSLSSCGKAVSEGGRSPRRASSGRMRKMAGCGKTRRLLKKVQMQGGARGPHARRTLCTLSVRPRAPYLRRWAFFSSLLGLEAGAVRHDRPRRQHHSGPHPGARADPPAGGDDAVTEDRVFADRHAIPDHRARDTGPASYHAPCAQHSLGADAALGVEPAPGADHAGPGDRGRRLECDVAGDPAPVRSGDEAGPGGHLAGHQVELGLAVLGGAADVEPIVAADPAVEGDALGEEAGKELALDGHHPSLGDAAEQLPLEEIDARVDRVRRHEGGIWLLDEAQDTAGLPELYETVRRRARG